MNVYIYINGHINGAPNKTQTHSYPIYMALFHMCSLTKATNSKLETHICKNEINNP